MLVRGIRKKEIREALRNRETSYPSKNPAREVVLGTTFDGRRLKIVVNKADGSIVTVADRDEED